MAWTGVKEGIKQVLVTALQNAFTEEFWASLNPETLQIDPAQVVMADYPQQATAWPILRVDVLLSEAHWGNISMSEKDGATADIIGKGTFMCDLYSLWSPGRDRLSDGLTALLLFREAFPGYNVFDQCIKNMAQDGYPMVNLDKGLMTFGTDDEGMGVPWEPNEKIYATSLSVGFTFEWAMSVDNLAEIIKEIDTTVNMERK